MWSVGLLSLFGMVVPLYVGMEIFGLGLYFAWSCLVVFLFLLAATTVGRFRLGKWKSMRVIEQ
jgi:MATE family multidrug resistance protein